LWIVAVLETQVALFSVLYWALGAPVVSCVVLAVGVALTTVPAVLRRSLTAAVHYEVALLMVILDVVAWYTGGLYAPALFWTIATPIMATMAGGRRAGYAWFAGVCANAVTFAALTLLGHNPTSVLAPWAQSALTGVAVAMLAFVVFVLAMVYEATTDAMTKAVDEANQGMRRVLDNVEQGFIMVDAEGKASAQRSAVLEQWFGPLPQDTDPTVWAWLSGGDECFAAFVQGGWEAAFDGIFPIELAIDQLPKQIISKDRTFAVSYRPVIGRDGTTQSLILVLSDVTAQVEADKAQRRQREHAALFERLTQDRRGFLQFWDEAETILHDLRAGTPNARRLIHTLKGNAGFFGLESVTNACHAVEWNLSEHGEPPTTDDIAQIEGAWAKATARIAALLASEKQRFEVHVDDLTKLEDAIARRVEHMQLAGLVKEWRFEQTRHTFGRVGEHAQALAERLGKGPVNIVIEDNGMRLDPATWAPIWAALTHAIRNAVDHGIEEADVRAEAGKPKAATMRFSSAVWGNDVVIEISDDGGGVNWERVREKAAAMGLPHETEDELTRALFSDGFSTRDRVSEVSGRGVGLSALAASVHEAGGILKLVTTRGVGTTLRIIAAREASQVFARAS
jgi:two-component system chemotaxis sensor kinase CheA